MTEATPSNLIVEMQGIVKRFPGVLANDHVDFELRSGELHELLGENGALKHPCSDASAHTMVAPAGAACAPNSVHMTAAINASEPSRLVRILTLPC